jgi:hypothetical protein
MLPANEKVLSNFSMIWREHQKDTLEKSITLNIFKYFRPDEPMHSRLLAMLLDPKGEHGQGVLFLHTFLRKIGIEFNENSDRWSVTAELERIDVLIRSSSGHVIIIENKSNWAQDQDSQLYRYWYRAMFLPNFKENSDPFYTLTRKERFQIIYLVPNNAKIPSDYSLKKSKDIDSKNELGLPEQLDLELHIQIMTFSDDIVLWLEDLLHNFKSNHRLREYLNQYIELWKTN